MNQKKTLKVLFITFSSIDLNTSATIRNIALMDGLVKNGVSVDLLTLSTHNSNVYYDKSLKTIDGVDIIRLKQNIVYSSVVKQSDGLKGLIKKKLLPHARKLYHSFNLFDNTVINAKNINMSTLQSNYYDIIISSSDPKSSHIAAETLVKSGLKYGQWLQYWGDPLALDITSKSLHPKWYVRKVEENILSKADVIVYVSPFTLEAQQFQFPSVGSKMHFIPVPYIQPKHYENNIKKKQRLTLGYFGDFDSTVRDIKPIYNYALESGEELIIAGNSDLELNNKNNINIYPRVTQEKLYEMESKSDVLVCVLNKKGTQIPGKIYHYAATNKPILVLLDGENKERISEYLDTFGRYIICNNTESDIELAINKIRKHNMRWEPSPFFESQFVARKFIELCKVNKL
ncbi:hypothetical protein [Gudongella oleilytica]|jgi:hypothetical protein|uniref:hypothetical protein n=1 Tax=Gudongella oleilytica TaxID=1582259 RepID=UPI002A365AF8|nr:hypothetical protein [Gudongella oleilytica]MDY0257243.1 hypothetical protein [Gudongella oleilytica]